MSLIGFTSPYGNNYRIDDKESEITAISPIQKLCYSHIDLDNLFLWRTEADEKNLPSEAEDAFFREKAAQFMKNLSLSTRKHALPTGSTSLQAISLGEYFAQKAMTMSQTPEPEELNRIIGRR